MAYHKEFAKAGKKEGLQVWRIEKMDLSPVPPEQHGNFYTGDSYIVLFTVSMSATRYNVHTWFGAETSQDEKVSAAIFMIQLDDFLGGHPAQFTEYQSTESNTFLSYFKSLGLKYKKGGVNSGFNHVVTNKIEEKRLLHVKGRRTVRAKEVDLSWESFNKGDCFIILLNEKMYHWSGSESNHFERLKTTEFAIGIRDNERGGRGSFEMIDEGSESEEVIKELGPKPDLPPGTSDSDKKSDLKHKSMATLYLISDASGSMTTSVVKEENPFMQNMLSPKDCYLLDNGGERIFIWKGPQANVEERKAALAAAKKFIKEKNYSLNTQVQILPAGAETTLFKQFFHNWLDKDETTGPSKAYVIGRIANVKQIPFDASKLHSDNNMAVQHNMVDDGSGKVQIWRVEGGDKVPVDKSTYGQFFGGDCYLVLYTYRDTQGKEKHIIYTWQGNKCSKDELGASAILTVNLDDSMGGVATQVRVSQGQEPAHLVSLCKGKPLVVHLGGTSRKFGETKPGSTRLFHIRLSSTKATRAIEVDPSASSLNTNDMFTLKTPQSLFLWKGKGGTLEELAAAKYVASLLGGNPIEVEETKEPTGFWEALGGKKGYQTSPALQRTIKPPRLFACSNKTGRLIAEEVPGEFTQMDLAPDDVMILDTWDQIFVWIGKDANETERSGSMKIAEDYVNSDPSGRHGTPINTIKQGNEPLTFTGWFHAWDAKMWETDLLETLKARIFRK